MSSYRLAMKEIGERRERAQKEHSRRCREAAADPRAKELMSRLSRTGSSIVQAVSAGPENCQARIQAVMRENLSVQRELRGILEEMGLPGDYLEVPYTCKSCGDTGYVSGKKCACLRELIAKYNAEAFNEASHVTLTSFESFSLRYYPTEPAPSPRQTMSAILDFCKAYAGSFTPHSPSVLMIGETGLGKTHLSLAIAGKVMEKGLPVAYASAPDLFRKLQNEYYGRGGGEDTLQTLLDAALLIIDDLGAEIENQFNVSALYNIVNTRLNAGRPVLISTNLPPKELERRYTDRVASRLLTMYKCLRFSGRDVRQIKLRSSEL